jgi:hypothetical protein
MNRRGTEPYARWCERPGRATSPAYSIVHYQLPDSTFSGGAVPIYVGVRRFAMQDNVGQGKGDWLGQRPKHSEGRRRACPLFP